MLDDRAGTARPQRASATAGGGPYGAQYPAALYGGRQDPRPPSRCRCRGGGRPCAAGRRCAAAWETSTSPRRRRLHVTPQSRPTWLPGRTAATRATTRCWWPCSCRPAREAPPGLRPTRPISVVGAPMDSSGLPAACPSPVLRPAAPRDRGRPVPGPAPRRRHARRDGLGQDRVKIHSWLFWPSGAQGQMIRSRVLSSVP